MGKKSNDQVVLKSCGNQALSVVVSSEKQLTLRKRISAHSRAGKAQKIIRQSPAAAQTKSHLPARVAENSEIIQMATSAVSTEGKKLRNYGVQAVSSSATANTVKVINGESSISLEMRSFTSLSTNISCSNSQSDHNSNTASTMMTNLTINSNSKTSTLPTQTSLFSENFAFQGSIFEGKKGQTQQRKQRLKVQNLFVLPQEKCRSIITANGNNNSSAITSSVRLNSAEKSKTTQANAKKITKKQLQKFIPEDSTWEMAEILQNLQESISLYNYKQPLSNTANLSKNIDKSSSLAAPQQQIHHLVPKKRILLVDNVIKLGVYFRYPRTVVHNAIALFDVLFLQTGFQVKEKSLSLYAITALFIALKREDSSKHSLSTLVDFARQYTAEEFLNCELAILNLMKWQICPPSLESVSGIMIELLENKCFKGCGYMKENVEFQAMINVIIDLINLKENLTTFGMCLKLLALAVIYVTVILTQQCFPSVYATRVELTENIFRLQHPPSYNSTKFAKINNLFSQFMRTFLGLNQISDIALEIQFVAKFINFFSDLSILSCFASKNLRLQHEYPNSLQFLTSSKEF